MTNMSIVSGIEDAYPLTRLQLGMLFHSEHQTDSAVYHDIFSYQLQAPWNRDTFQHAVNQLVMRHAVLRTSFDLSSFSEPLQLVHHSISLAVSYQDIRSLPSIEQENVIDQWIAREKRQRFDWKRPPLFRIQVHHCSEETWWLTLSFHHAILDGWSVASLLTELLHLYAFHLGLITTPVLPPPTTLFRDFVGLEQEALASEQHQLYWTNSVGDRAITKLPCWDIPEQDKKQGRRIKEVSMLPAISDGLTDLARSLGVPLKSVLLAAHIRMLGFLTNNPDILTGLVLNGRPETIDGERTLGLFLNTVPFRIQLRSESWIDLIQRVFEVEREVLSFRRYPLSELLRLLKQPALFETTFNFNHFHVYQQIASTNAIRFLGGKYFEETNFPFSVSFSLDGATSLIGLRFAYENALFCEEQVSRMTGYYLRAFEAMVHNPRARYVYTSLLSEQELHKMLIEWNATQSLYPVDLCFHHLFEKQVDRTPERVALVFQGKQLTYAELDRRANQVAHYLQTKGIGPDTLVGLCVPRSLEMLIALLGILKAGGAYVPLDPTYPSNRLAFMLSDSHVSLILTQSTLLSHLPFLGVNRTVVCLDTHSQVIAQQPDNRPQSQVGGQNLAYVIYTSGSTGQPKGVQITHQGLANLATHSSTFGIDASRHVLQFASLNFDAFLWEIAMTLPVGAALYLDEQSKLLPGPDLIPFLQEQSITTLHMPPSALAVLPDVELPAQQEIVVGGEACPTELALRWFQRCRFFNIYGPTETTVYVTRTAVEDLSPNSQYLNIGHPICNTQIYILDRYFQPVPIATPGEIYIGGVGLARGYLNRPDLTAERFIPHPFSKEAGARLYRTGDQARYLPDGSIEFLGRLDHQVKIRGYRIELGEIEAVLTAHSGVKECAVLARKDAYEAYLVAYVVLHEGEKASSDDLRCFLQQQLPGYMVPKVFILLSSLPLTPHFKVDRQALLSLEQNIEVEESKIVHIPRDQIELQLVQLWEDILKRHPISITDNFFDLGGHSLSAVRLIAHIHKCFARDISLSTLLQNPTIEQLGSLIRREGKSVPWSPLVRLQTRGSHPPLFCIHPAGGSVMCYIPLARHMGTDQPFYALQAPDTTGTTHWRLEDLATSYIKAIQTYQPQGPYLLSGWSMGGLIAFETACQLRQQGHDIDLLALIDTTAPTSEWQSTMAHQEAPLSWFVKDLLGRYADDSVELRDMFTQLNSQLQLTVLCNFLKERHILPPDTGVPQLVRSFEIFQANVQAAKNYKPRLYPGKLDLFVANDSQRGNKARIDWQAFSAEDITFHRLPGNHYTLMREPHVQFLAEQLKTLMRKLQKERNDRIHGRTARELFSVEASRPGQ